MSSFGQIHRISISSEKGVKKKNIDRAELKEQYGIIGDAHAGSGRQVSLLPFESFDSVREKLDTIQPGDFAENLTTSGIDLSSTTVGSRIMIGNRIELLVTQIGKKCHLGCYIREIVGDCIMPREGIFAAVVRGGSVSVGDKIEMVSP